MSCEPMFTLQNKRHPTSGGEVAFTRLICNHLGELRPSNATSKRYERLLRLGYFSSSHFSINCLIIMK